MVALTTLGASCGKKPDAGADVLNRWPELAALAKLAPIEAQKMDETELIARAEGGDPEAAALLIQEWYRGDALNRNRERAAAYLPRAVELGHPMALYYLAVHQELGLTGDPTDVEDANASWQTAYQELLNWTKPLTGHQLDALCLIHWRGKGGAERSGEKALDYCIRACKFDLPRPWTRRGWFHEHGICGAEESQDLAFEAYQQAARLGSTVGFYHLGRCYLEGIGTTPNRDVALACLLRSAQKGHAEAQIDLEQLLEHGKNRFAGQDLDEPVIPAAEDRPEFRFAIGERIAVSTETQPESWEGVILRAERGRYLVRVETALSGSISACVCTGQLDLGPTDTGEKRWILESCANAAND